VARPRLFGIDTASDLGYYYTVLVIAALVGVVLVIIRRGRLGRLLRGLGNSPVALEAHGANTRVTRLLVFCICAGFAAVGGVLLVGVTQSASGQSTGPFGYFDSLLLVVVLAFSGRRPIVSPLIAATVFEVIKIYPPFNQTWFLNYEGVFFGVVAIGAAVWSASGSMTVSKRVAERASRSPITERAEPLRVPLFRTEKLYGSGL
jgi:ABC-type branched-subunit amino acid transport system permease subunit